MAGEGKVGAWIPGKVYGAGGKIHAGDTPFSDADFQSAATAGIFDDTFDTLNTEWFEDPTNHKLWVVSGGQLRHNGDDSGTGDSPNAPGIRVDEAHSLGTELDISLLFETEVNRLDTKTDRQYLIVVSPGSVQVIADWGAGQYSWDVDGATGNTAGSPAPSNGDKITVHVRRINDTGQANDYRTGIYVNEALIFSSDRFAAGAATNFDARLLINRDASAVAGDDTGEYEFFRVEGKAH